MEGTILNPKLTDRFLYVVAGIADYEAEGETSLIDIFSRLRAEARLTDSNWNLFGFRNSPSVGYYEKNLGKEEIDIVFVPQNDAQKRFPTDEDEWREASAAKKTGEELFPHNLHTPSREDNHESTWYLSSSERERGHWIQEVPRFFDICHLRGSVYRGLVFRNLELSRYGEKWLDGSTCNYRTTQTVFKRKQARSLQIYEKLDEPHDKHEYVPVIATAKLIYPYAVNLVHPKDHKPSR